MHSQSNSITRNILRHEIFYYEEDEVELTGGVNYQCEDIISRLCTNIWRPPTPKPGDTIIEAALYKQYVTLY